MDRKEKRNRQMAHRKYLASIEARKQFIQGGTEHRSLFDNIYNKRSSVKTSKGLVHNMYQFMSKEN